MYVYVSNYCTIVSKLRTLVGYGILSLLFTVVQNNFGTDIAGRAEGQFYKTAYLFQNNKNNNYRPFL